MDKQKVNGVWEIRTKNDDKMILRFRAYKQRDINLQLKKAEIGLKIPADNLVAVFVAEWLD
jgi:hypothetical protein